MRKGKVHYITKPRQLKDAVYVRVVDEASTLENPQARPKISRVFRTEGLKLLNFRGPLEAEDS